MKKEVRLCLKIKVVLGTTGKFYLLLLFYNEKIVIIISESFSFFLLFINIQIFLLRLNIEKVWIFISKNCSNYKTTTLS